MEQQHEQTRPQTPALRAQGTNTNAVHAPPAAGVHPVAPKPAAKAPPKPAPKAKPEEKNEK
jgi:hypothetical protein